MSITILLPYTLQFFNNQRTPDRKTRKPATEVLVVTTKNLQIIMFLNI